MFIRDWTDSLACAPFFYFIFRAIKMKIIRFWLLLVDRPKDVLLVVVPTCSSLPKRRRGKL